MRFPGPTRHSRHSRHPDASGSPQERTCMPSSLMLRASSAGRVRGVGNSLDHLIGSSKKSGRDGEAERLGGFRLTTIKYFRGICTGSSDGFAPRRMLSIQRALL